MSSWSSSKKADKVPETGWSCWRCLCDEKERQGTNDAGNKAAGEKEKQEGNERKGEKKTRFPSMTKLQKTNHTEKYHCFRLGACCRSCTGSTRAKSLQIKEDIRGTVDSNTWRSETAGRKALCCHMLLNQLKQQKAWLIDRGAAIRLRPISEAWRILQLKGQVRQWIVLEGTKKWRCSFGNSIRY